VIVGMDSSHRFLRAAKLKDFHPLTNFKDFHTPHHHHYDLPSFYENYPLKVKKMISLEQSEILSE